MTSDLPTPLSRRRLWAEIGIVLGLSLGASAVYSLVAIAVRLSRGPLSQQSTALNSSRSDLEVFDLIYQVLAVFFDLVPVALVCYLLWNVGRPHLGRLGLAFDRPLRDSAWGALLFVAVGVPGLFAYFGFRAVGLNVAVQPSPLDTFWWTVPVLLLSAARAAITEEVIVIGYLFARLRDVGWGRWQIIIGSALVRGSYHLYQGFGGFIANAVMGIAFGWLYTRYGRLLPLVVTHFLLDAVVFIGYPWAFATFPALFI